MYILAGLPSFMTDSSRLFFIKVEADAISSNPVPAFRFSERINIAVIQLSGNIFSLVVMGEGRYITIELNDAHIKCACPKNPILVQYAADRPVLVTVIIAVKRE